MSPVRPDRRLDILIALWALTALAGCQSQVDDRLVVATTWTGADCARIEVDFDRWISSRSEGSAAARRPGIHWIRLSQGDDLDQFARRRKGVDVLLGGAIESYRTIESAGLLGPATLDGKASRLAIESPDRGEVSNKFPVTRMTPRFLELARTELSRDAWTSGYERLLRLSEKPPEAGSPSHFSSAEGAAIVAGARHRNAAVDLMAFLVEQRGAKPEAPGTTVDPVFDGFLADLLRATLFDSRDELGAARKELEHIGYSDQLVRWMCEPPPWPPASVATIQARGGDQAMTMIETLAGQIAPDPRLRSWLLRSWLSPPRRIDGEFLEELSRVDEGRLAREPRFRAWLRAEWTAWARQRYRRVARQARSGRSIVEAKPSPPARPQAEKAEAR